MGWTRTSGTRERGWRSFRASARGAATPAVEKVKVDMYEAIKWPEDMTPSRSPIHFTNELVVAASVETIWSLQDVYASVQELEPMTRIAWGGGPKASLESKAYHAWIITPTARWCRRASAPGLSASFRTCSRRSSNRCTIV